MFKDTIRKVIKKECSNSSFSYCLGSKDAGIIIEAIDEAIRLDKAENSYIKCEECKCLLELKDALIVKVLKEYEGDKYYCRRCKPKYDVINKDGTTYKNKK
jgi:hypothetical protein